MVNSIVSKVHEQSTYMKYVSHLFNKIFDRFSSLSTETKTRNTQSETINHQTFVFLKIEHVF